MINDRIAFLIRALDLNANSFAEQIGVSATVIYNIVKGRRNKPSYDLLIKILSVFNQINTNWLMMGEGEDWLVAEVTEDTPHTLIDKIQSLISTIEADNSSSPEAQELAELAQVLVEDYSEKQGGLDMMRKQQQQIVGLLKRELKVLI